MKQINLIIILTILLSVICTPVFALEDPRHDGVVMHENILTYEDAVQLAIDNSRTLKSMRIDIEIAYEKRSKASETVNYFSLDAKNNTGYFSLGGDAGHAAITGAINGLIALDRQWQIAQKNYELEEQKTAYRVLTAYQNILKAKQDITTSEKALETAQYDWKIAELKNQYGLISSFDKIQAEQKLIAAKDAVNSKRMALDSKYIELSKLLGNSNPNEIIKGTNNDEIIFSTLPVIEELVDFDIDLHINRTISVSPTIFMFEQKAYLAQMQVDNYTFNQNTYDTYTVKKLEVEAANLDIVTHKKQLAEGMRSIYAGIKELEAGYQELITMEETLLKAYDNTKLFVELGMVAKIEVIKLEEQLESIAAQKFSLISQHEQLVHTLYNPWVMG